MRKIIVGSRKSELALKQTELVINELKTFNLPYEFAIKTFVTKGDKILDLSLAKIGGKGLFVKELEQALLDKEIDFAVHSLKDLPGINPEGLAISSIPKREDPRDAFLSVKFKSFKDLPEGAKVGTSSLRRTIQLKELRPDLNFEPLRGNINTRLRKLQANEFDAIILAAAGIHRIGWQKEIKEYFSVDEVIPAVGQGALAIQTRANDEELINIVRLIHDEITAKTVHSERAFLAKMEGSCQIPIGAHAILIKEKIELSAFIASIDGKNLLKEKLIGNDPLALGNELALMLLKQGGREILAQVNEMGEVNGV